MQRAYSSIPKNWIRQARIYVTDRPQDMEPIIRLAAHRSLAKLNLAVCPVIGEYSHYWSLGNEYRLVP